MQKLNIEYNIQFACDIDKYCKQTYFANYDIKEENWYNDIKEIDVAKYKNKIDLFVGGSPCQSFSVIGLRKGLQDHRGNLAFEYFNMVDLLKPKVFIFENVKGLLTIEKGKVLEMLENKIKDIGYTYYKKVLNAKDYGIPQNRERLFIIGFLEKRDFTFPSPFPLKLSLRDLLLQNKDIDNKYYLSEEGRNHILRRAEKGFAQINGNIARCLTTSQTSGDFIIHYSKLRRLLIRERARLMGFNDTIEFPISYVQGFKQTGNSIVVNVLMCLLKSIYNLK